MNELEQNNKQTFYDIVYREYHKITDKVPVYFDNDCQFEVTAEVYFNNPLVKGYLWHGTLGSGFNFQEIVYEIRVSPQELRCFVSKEEAENWLKKTRNKKITDKSKVKIQKAFQAYDNAKNIYQLEEKYYDKLLKMRQAKRVQFSRDNKASVFN